MKKQKLKLVALLSILFIFTTSSSWAAAPFFPKLVVSGTAILHKPADQLGLNISIQTQSDSADKALADNNDKMQDLIDSLQIAGLVKGEYHTGQFSINPVYSTPPRNNTPPDWRATIIGYDVTNTVTIHTQQLDLAPILIDAAGQAGATQISNINFTIKDTNIHRTEVISQATANALRDAEALAEAANIKIVRILDITLDQPQIYTRPGQNMMYMAKSERLPFIEAPDVDISANVSVTFEIATKA